MGNENTLLKRLLEQEAALKEKIKQARIQEQKKQTQLHNSKAKIIGLAVLAEMAKNDRLADMIKPIIDKHTTSAKERKLLNLPPLKKPETVKDNKDKFTTTVNSSDIPDEEKTNPANAG